MCPCTVARAVKEMDVPSERAHGQEDECVFEPSTVSASCVSLVRRIFNKGCSTYHPDISFSNVFFRLFPCSCS